MGLGNIIKKLSEWWRCFVRGEQKGAGAKTDNGPGKEGVEKAQKVGGAEDKNQAEEKGGHSLDNKGQNEGQEESDFSATPEEPEECTEGSGEEEQPSLLEADTGRGVKLPLNAGGRRGTKTDKDTEGKSNRSKGVCKPVASEPQYSLLCREVQGKWHICLKRQVSDRKFSQNSEPLSFDGNGECRLPDFRTPVVTEGEEIPLFDGKPLIFILQGGGSVGKISQFRSKGRYIVIAPIGEWKRKDGQPADRAQVCADRQFFAYMVFGSEVEEFDTGDTLALSKRFSLDGEKVIYEDSDKGDLLTGECPYLQDSREWEDVAWVRVGLEDDNSQGNNHNFLPSEVGGESWKDWMSKKSGWFYIRVYENRNGASHLIFPLQFRFFPELQKILIDGENFSASTIIVPSAGGHKKSEISFVAVDGGNITIVPKNDNYIKVSGNTATADPRVGRDFTEWTLQGGHGSVDVDIMLPRIWWRIGGEEWTDRPLLMTRESFYERQDDDLEIILPAYVGSISAELGEGNGRFRALFDESLPDSHRVRRKIAKIPLRFFADNPCIHEPSYQSVDLLVKLPDMESVEFPIVRIKAELRENDDNMHFPPLYPEVKGVCGPRKGKGFSIAELQEAGIVTSEAGKMHINVDKRRKSCYNPNVICLTERKECYAK